jgi:hypothetical protein
MKSFYRFLLLLLVLAIMGGSTLQANQQQPKEPAENPLLVVGEIMSEQELVALVSQAHYSTVQLFSTAFEAELYTNSKPSWEEVHPELVKYWSPFLVDGDLKTFYDAHLWEWGYEMGFAFPLWKPETIEKVTLVSWSENEIIAEFEAPVNYEDIDTIQIVLIRKNGKWFIDSHKNIQMV